ncbi:hypothetical protein CC80DRAFT_554821 [Byssothecium circinans]|uniref:Uncharacterized protein n=1 Tax=Byssothecium circinans TaxID=147558 RepID=A0A6A5TBD3_9PLEO|nr:hypothetical protein CC80DRAFT_554821 [Byssothecium circinans]
MAVFISQGVAARVVRGRYRGRYRIEGGVEGGIEGGVEGGIEGGVEGGIEGGIEGVGGAGKAGSSSRTAFEISATALGVAACESAGVELAALGEGLLLSRRLPPPR